MACLVCAGLGNWPLPTFNFTRNSFCGQMMVPLCKNMCVKASNCIHIQSKSSEIYGIHFNQRESRNDKYIWV